MFRLDRYLLKQFFGILGVSLLGFISIFLIVDLIENLDRFIDNGVPGKIIFNYYLYSIPYFVSVALPMAMLISTVFGLGMLVKRNEWTAMKSSGISLYRLSTPLLLTGLIISMFSFILDNQVVEVELGEPFYVMENVKIEKIIGNYINSKSSYYSQTY